MSQNKAILRVRHFCSKPFRTPKAPFVFKVGGKIIGTARLDVLDSKRAAVRLVAITKSEQGKGFGRALMNQLEETARNKGVSLLVLNSATTAVGFYERLGFVKQAWNDPEISRAEAERVQMIKRL